METRQEAVRVDFAGAGEHSGPLLEARDVSLVYRTKTGTIAALENLSLSLAEGEFVAVLGPSGCGKSTFLKIAAGLLPTSTGQVLLNGTPTTRPRPDVGVVFQQPMLMPWKNVLNNVLIATLLGFAEKNGPPSKKPGSSGDPGSTKWLVAGAGFEPATFR